MTFLFSIRETIKNFYQRFQLLLRPMGKFLFCFLFFWALSQMLPYAETVGKIEMVLGFSFLCMWLPLGATFFLSIFYMEIELFSSLPDIAIFYGIFFIVIYLLYIRFNIKSCFPLLIIPIAMIFHVPYVVPIIIGISVGTVGIVPMILGIILYFFNVHIKETVALLGTATESTEYIQIYSNLLHQLFADKEMLLMLVVFPLVVVIFTGLMRIGNAEVQKISIYLSGVCGLILFLVGGYVLEVEMNIVSLLVGFSISIIVGLLLQFFKGTLDFSRIEYTQFEDEEYYYYVKAVPKISVAQKEVNVKKINTRKHEKIVEEVK